MDIDKFNTLMKTARRAGNQEDWQIFNDIVNELNMSEDLSEKQRKIISDLELSFLDDEWQKFKPVKSPEEEEEEDLVSLTSERVPEDKSSQYKLKLKKDDIVVEFHTRSFKNQDKSKLKNKLEEFVQKNKQMEANREEDEDASEFAGMSMAKRAARRAAARKEARKKREAELKKLQEEEIATPEAVDDVDYSDLDDEKRLAAEIMHKAALEGAEKAAKMRKEQKQHELEQMERERAEQEKLKHELEKQEKVSRSKIAKERAEADRLAAEQKAIEELRAREMEKYKDAFALFKKASVQPKTQGEKIIELCNKAIEIYPEFDEAYFLRATIYDDRNEYDNQIADLSRVVQILRQKEIPNKDKTLSKVFKKLGKVFVAINDWENAIKSYTSILKYDPESQSAYLNRGLIWQEMQVMDKALEDFEAAIKINPDKLDSYILSAKILKNNEEYEKAIEYLTKVHENDPDNIDVLRDRGECYFKSGSFKKALPDFNTVISKKPREISTLLYRAQSMIKLRDWEEAEDELTNIIQIDSNNLDAYRFRLEVFKKLGKKDEARLDSKRIRKLENDRQAQLEK